MAELQNLKQTPAEWLEDQFEYEYCGECGGDAEHHTVIVDFPFPGTNFARCDFPADAESDMFHPTIAAFRTKARMSNG